MIVDYSPYLHLFPLLLGIKQLPSLPPRSTPRKVEEQENCRAWEWDGFGRARCRAFRTYFGSLDYRSRVSASLASFPINIIPDRHLVS